MWVIFEGPDATGKSTRAKQMADNWGWKLVSSEGPEKYRGEAIERAERYLSMPENTIFDRHPCVSQPIYGLYSNGSRLPDDLIKRFYDAKPFLIYCRPGPATVNHKFKDYDDEMHRLVIRHYKEDIQHDYDMWAVEHAHTIYRMGETTKAKVKLVMWRERG